MSSSNGSGVLQEITYALVRLVSGLCFSLHGVQKILGWFGGSRAHPFSQMWFAGIIELTCGLAMALGLGARWAAFLASGEMAVAYIQVHWQLHWDVRFLPVVNKGELALVYCFLFLYMAARGNGRFSLGGRS